MQNKQRGHAKNVSGAIDFAGLRAVQFRNPAAIGDPMAQLTNSALLKSATSVVGRIAQWNATRETRNSLSKLSAHELADIGLVAGDIDAISN